MTTNPGKAYRQQLIHTESAPDIFIHAYDRVVSLLHSAAAATEARDIESKTLHLNRALDLVVCLQGALNFEEGGDVASNLDRFYTLLRGQIFKGSARLDAEILRQAARHVVEVRKLWERAQSAGSPHQAAGPAPFPHPAVVDSSGDAPQNSPPGSWSA